MGEPVGFLAEALTENQPRDDYRELMELTFMFLGTALSRGARYTTPGLMHKACWMSKVIYALKVWMFRSQFQLSKYESAGLRELCIFHTLIYIKAWSTRYSSSA